ncbi:apolipoprotein L2-like [Sphaeramia orbicularis]|uniref:Apolipoprotein L2-like n=1 Tax=Sphaeramia orbicularis TaxID=375764 RepID=A0A672YNE4_9TELE|nr:apolipoprotein L2-like [Sphaeramia orbicularis]
MSATRKQLQEALCRFAADTFASIDTVTEFVQISCEWLLVRQTELNMLKDVKHRADNIVLNVRHVTASQSKGAAFKEYVKSKFYVASRRTALEEELAAILKETLRGLEELDRFLDAVERLSVTSTHVFKDLPGGGGMESVQDAIEAARLVCPLILEFKREASAFFTPRLQNVEVLVFQLDRYMQTTQTMCGTLGKSSFSRFCVDQTVADMVEDLSEDDVQHMVDRINRLEELRNDRDFRMVFLFQGSCSNFITEFSERRPRMLQFLNDLEESAVQLDRMKKGSKISSVAGSSVGAVGGVLSIVGLALTPVTAGASLVLMMTGIGLGITSGVNSAVTTAAEVGVNCKHEKKANEVFRNFMEDVQVLQDTLEEVAKQRETSSLDVALGVGKVLYKAGGVGRRIGILVEGSSAVKMLKSEELVANAGKMATQEGKALGSVPRVAADVPDISQAAAKGPLALSKAARGGAIVLSALFLGMDVIFICKDGVSLAKGGIEAEVSQFIRARAGLWRSEVDSWQKIHDSLQRGQQTSEEKHHVLETPFYPDVKTKKPRKTEDDETPEDGQGCLVN